MGSVGFYPEEGPVREVEVVSRSIAGRLWSRGLPGLLRRPGIGRSPSGHRRPLTTWTPIPCCWSRDRRCFVPLPTPFHSIQRSAWKGNSQKFGRCTTPASLLSFVACGVRSWSLPRCSGPSSPWWRGAAALAAPKPRTNTTLPKAAARLLLHPEGDSGVRGTATLEDVSKGVLVELELRGLPKPDTLYLAHIHPGTCAREEKKGRCTKSTTSTERRSSTPFPR
jgi:hypothetical protein